MRKLLYYLWKGIFTIISICSLPITWNYVKYCFNHSGKNLVGFCVTSVYLAFMLGLVIMLGFYVNLLIESLNPKNK